MSSDNYSILDQNELNFWLNIWKIIYFLLSDTIAERNG